MLNFDFEFKPNYRRERQSEEWNTDRRDNRNQCDCDKEGFKAVLSSQVLRIPSCEHLEDRILAAQQRLARPSPPVPKEDRLNIRIFYQCHRQAGESRIRFF